MQDKSKAHETLLKINKQVIEKKQLQQKKTFKQTGILNFYPGQILRPTMIESRNQIFQNINIH